MDDAGNDEELNAMYAVSTCSCCCSWEVLAAGFSWVSVSMFFGTNVSSIKRLPKS